MASRTLMGTLVAVSVLLAPKPSEACSCIDIQRTEEQRVEDLQSRVRPGRCGVRRACDR